MRKRYGVPKTCKEAKKFYRAYYKAKKGFDEYCREVYAASEEEAAQHFAKTRNELYNLQFISRVQKYDI